ncbi:MAG: hypothetical protein HY769_04145 [Candidatus Stahlbacteria bacterium]|nr:hypothetical protein [Candidatus Stahlbacteria bacterium]
MSNPTIYRYPKKIIDNLDETVTEIDKSLRSNRDKNVIVKVKNSEGHTLVVYHLVYDSKGRVIHGPHEEPGSRNSNYKKKFPAINFFE